MPHQRKPPRKSPTATAKSLRAELRARLRGAAKPALLAVGSDLRADDAAGLLAAKYLRERGSSKRPRIRIFVGDTAPENLTGEIRRYGPSHLVVVDSADSGARPGAVRVMNLSDAVGGPTFSTHYLPLTVMLRYLLESMECDIIVLGIQPKSLEFGAAPSKAVDNAARRVAEAVREAVAGA